MKKGSHCGMSVWGRKENCLFFELIKIVYNKHGIPTDKFISAYIEDKDEIKRQFTEAGFTNFKLWY
jgi:hypothetical protein